MKIYLSWSGDRSRAVAESLGRWLRQVIQAVEPWSPGEGDQGGGRVAAQAVDALEDARIGIICLTPENLSDSWVMFEAGALSSGKGRILYTFLLDVNPADVRQPLGQFQHASSDRTEVWRLLTIINNALLAGGGRGLEAPLLEQVFRIYWPLLEQELAEISATAPPSPPTSERSDRELVEEMLELLRGQQRHLANLEKSHLRATAAAVRAQRLQAAAQSAGKGEGAAGKAVPAEG